MVTDQRKRRSSGQDNVQDVGVRGVQEESAQAGSNADDLRLLDSRKILLHYDHIQNGYGYQPERCGFCRGGLEGVIRQIEQPEPDVVQSSGADEKADSTPTPAGEWAFRESG